MKREDAAQFNALLEACYELYNKPLSDGIKNIWWRTLRPFDFEAVSEAFSRWLVNTEAGKWLPRPADILQMMGGTATDGSLIAWSTVERAIRRVGPWRSIQFEDALIGRVVSEMGGWVKLCSTDDKELPFVAKEFQTRYRGYAMRSEFPTTHTTNHGLAYRGNGGHIELEHIVRLPTLGRDHVQQTAPALGHRDPTGGE